MLQIRSSNETGIKSLIPYSESFLVHQFTKDHQSSLHFHRLTLMNLIAISKVELNIFRCNLSIK